MQCSYCDENANFTLKNGKACCSTYSTKCPAIKRKNQAGLQKAHADGKMRYDQLDARRAWSKGKTSFSDPRIRSANRTAIFTDGSKVSPDTLKRILVLEGLLKYQCAKCGNEGLWCDTDLVLQLEHKNGRHSDNRLENLEFLCPNCHSQTDTFCNKKRLGSEPRRMISDEELLDALNSYSTILPALRSLGISGAGNYARVYRLLAKHGLARPVRKVRPPKVQQIKVSPPIRECPICSIKLPRNRKHCSTLCAGKAQEKINWEDYDLSALYREHGSMLALVRFFENKISDNGIRKQMKKQGISFKKTKINRTFGSSGETRTPTPLTDTCF